MKTADPEQYLTERQGRPYVAAPLSEAAHARLYELHARPVHEQLGMRREETWAETCQRFRWEYEVAPDEDHRGEPGRTMGRDSNERRRARP